MAEFGEQPPIEEQASAPKQNGFDWQKTVGLTPEAKLALPKIILGTVVAALFVVLLITVLVTVKAHKSDNPTSDLGDGISVQSGLRGHLTTKWDGKLKYQMRLESIGPVQQPGFAYVTGNAPQPYSMNIRLLDSTGFALCGKEILFPFNPKRAAGPPPSDAKPGTKQAEAERIAEAQAAHAAGLQQGVADEAAREKGKDMLVIQPGPDGQVISLNVQGELPCAVDAYQRANYWDFTTNFPSTDEQTAIMNRPGAERARQAEEAAARARAAAAQKKAHMFGEVAFYMQGDARVTNYDAGRGLLEAGPNASFIVDKKAQTVAAGWGANNLLIHYKCDQKGSCILITAGGGGGIHGRLME